MAKRYYNLEKETKAFLKRMEETRVVLPDAAGISRINDYIVKRKGSGLFLGNVSPRTGTRFESVKSQSLSVANNTSLQSGTNGFTFSFWYRRISGSTNCIISKSIAGGASNSDYEIGQGGSNSVYFYVSNGTNTFQVSTGNAILIGINYFITCIFDNILNTVNVYVNGIFINSLAFTGSPLQSTTGFTIGRRTGGAIPLDGTLNDVGFWKRTLSTTELTYLYNNGLGRSYLELLAYNPGLLTSMSSYWALNEQGNTRIDWHGANNLQSINTPENDIGAFNNLFYLS